MRHRRFKQYIFYKYKNGEKAKGIYKKKKSEAIHFAKLCGSSISTMELGISFFTSQGVLDPTFKWDRRMNRVEWSYANGNTVTTKFALLKYPVGARKYN